MNILFTGDILRPSLINGIVWPSQKSNIEKYGKILSDDINSFHIEMVSDGYKEGAFDAVKMFSDISLAPSYDSWAATYEVFPSTSSEYNKFLKYIKSFDCVVGFELPIHLLKFLIESKIIFYTIQTSPIRFLSSRVYIDTNARGGALENLGWKSEIKDASVHSAAIKKRLALLKAIANRNIKVRCVLICLQTLYDKVRIKDGRFLRVWDYAEEILKIANDFECILIKPHPLEIDPVEVVYLMGLLPKGRVKVVSDDIYEYFLNPSVDLVVSISSSSCFEAKFFNKKSIFLYKNFYQEPDVCPELVSRYYVGDTYCSDGFWREILCVEND